MAFVLDTNIFNWLVDGRLCSEDLPSPGPFFATHLQIDEINATSEPERRAQLLLKFAEVRPQVIPSESAVWDATRWDYGKWSEGAIYARVKGDLDSRNRSRANNAKDALIGEVAIVNGYTLITADADLAAVVEALGSHVLFFKA